ncbi:hypothetical protein B0A52_07704 [Exophiala mesophila]|uniref:Heterokaryon incompatibility domain-containing protein n=1 Tax=Exophiala mesophila TaxID=212818 RepID=A0A438MXX4_EXOME|nr:hypothetical protein B0A52_07704 [Exophiala mesophila]
MNDIKYEHDIIVPSVPNKMHPFRCMNLLAGSGGLPIFITFDVGPLVQLRGSYEALSYAWDQAQKSAKVFVLKDSAGAYARQYILVTPGMHSILNKLRLPTQNRRLWIDQLCIEQDNNKGEKAGQLAIMRLIYEQAAMTVIFLDQPSSTERPILPLLDKMEELKNEIVEKFYHPNKASLPNMTTYKAFLLAMGNIPKVRFKVKLDEETVAAMIEFYGRRYFTRAWPFEEILSSKIIKVMYGDKFLSWEHLGYLSLWFTHMQDQAALSAIQRAGIEAVYYVFHYWNERPKRYPLIEMLRASRKYEAFEDVDKIYAIYGLITDTSNPDKIPKALQTVRKREARELYTDVARYILENDGHLQVLAFVDHFAPLPEGHSDLKLPSWVPDWRRKERVTQFWLFAPSADLNFNTGPMKSPAATFTQDSDRLMVRGVDVDRVIKIYSSFAEDDFNPEKLNWSRFDSLIVRFWAENMPSMWFAMTEGGNFSHLAVVMLYLLPAISVWPRTALPLLMIAGLCLILHPVPDTPRSSIEEALREQALVLSAGRNEKRTVSLKKKSDGGSQKSVDQHIRDYCAFLVAAAEGTRDGGRPLPLDKRVLPVAKMLASEGSVEAYTQACVDGLRNRVIFRTVEGKLGLGPLDVKEHDEIVVLRGGKVPFLLRESRNSVTEFQFVGACYLNGAMHGEFATAAPAEERDFVLV